MDSVRDGPAQYHGAVRGHADGVRGGRRAQAPVPLHQRRPRGGPALP